jgi:hypothetical protein
MPTLEASSAPDAACHDCGSASELKAYTLANTDFVVTLCQSCFTSFEQHGERYVMNRNKILVSPVEFALVAPDMWAINAYHSPGNANIPGVYQPNRCFVYRLRGNVLVVLNPTRLSVDKSEPVGALHRLEQRTKCTIKYIVSPDALHNMNLKVYADLFPEAKVLYPAGRIDRVIPDLAAKKNCSSFTASGGNADIDELKAAGLEFYLWRGAAEGKEDRGKRPMGTIEGSLVYFHPSRVLIQGSHLSWINLLTPSSSFLIRAFLGLKVGQYGVRCFAGTSALPLWDVDLFNQGLKKIQDLDWKYVSDLHLGPNQWGARDVMIGEYAKIKPGPMVGVKLQVEDKTA